MKLFCFDELVLITEETLLVQHDLIEIMFALLIIIGFYCYANALWEIEFIFKTFIYDTQQINIPYDNR